MSEDGAQCTECVARSIPPQVHRRDFTDNRINIMNVVSLALGAASETAA